MKNKNELTGGPETTDSESGKRGALTRIDAALVKRARIRAMDLQRQAMADTNIDPDGEFGTMLAASFLAGWLARGRVTDDG